MVKIVFLERYIKLKLNFKSELKLLVYSFYIGASGVICAKVTKICKKKYILFFVKILILITLDDLALYVLFTNRLYI